jgi:hypothetical protein
MSDGCERPGRYAGTRLLGTALAVLLLTACARGPAAGAPDAQGTGTASASASASRPGTATADPSPTSVPCWDGSRGAVGACPSLTGEPALRWSFTLSDDPECTRIGPWDPDVITLQYQCVWPDLKHSSAYLMQFTSQPDGTDFVTGSLSGKYKGMTPVDLRLDADPGPSPAMKWSGRHGTGSNGHRQDDTVVVYDSIPFGMWVGTDLTQGGTDDDHAKAVGRVKFRTAKAVGDVLDSAGKG